MVPYWLETLASGPTIGIPLTEFDNAAANGGVAAAVAVNNNIAGTTVLAAFPRGPPSCIPT